MSTVEAKHDSHSYGWGMRQRRQRLTNLTKSHGDFFWPNGIIFHQPHDFPETNSSPQKMDGWNTTFLLGRPILRGYVSFREGRFP